MLECLKAIHHQIFKEKDAFKNIFITHNAFGIFSKASHITNYDGVEKIKQLYPNLTSARKAAENMHKKYNANFSAYKCAYCSGYHIGKDRK